MNGIKNRLSTTVKYLKQFPVRTTFVGLSIFIVVLHFSGVKCPNAYSSGIVTELIGIMVTTFVVDWLFKNKRERDERVRERDEILRMARKLDQYFTHYENCFARLTSFGGVGGFDRKFEYRDLVNIYGSTASNNVGVLCPAYEGFFEIEKQIVSFMEQILVSKTFCYYPNVLDLFEKFILAHLAHDTSKTISETDKIFIDQKTCREIDKKMLSESTDETYKEHKAKLNECITGSPSDTYNAHAPYIHLCDLLIEERDIYNKYKQEIYRIKKEVP